MNPWEDIEADPEFSTLKPEQKTALFDDWHNNTLSGFTKLDPEEVDSAGMRGYMASAQAKRRQLGGESIDTQTAAKDWHAGLGTRRQAQQQTLADYDALEKARFRLRDAQNARSDAAFSDTYVGEGAKLLDENVALRKQEADRAGGLFSPEQEQQAREAREAMRGDRPVAVLGSDIYVNPELTLDKNAYRDAVNSANASPEAKVLALADFTNQRDRYAKEALKAFNSAAPIPGMQSFGQWDAEQPAEVRAKPPESKVLDYMLEMQKRSGGRKLASAAGTGSLLGGADVANQALGLSAMVSGSDALAKQAGEVSKGSEAMSEAQKMEGDMNATGATTTGGVARLGVGMTPAIVAGAVSGGSLPAAALVAGAQTAGSQFPSTYNSLVEQGKTPEEALSASRGAAVLSGAVTAALTTMGGYTGVEALLRQGGKQAVQSKLKSILLGSLKEIPEELTDELTSQVIESSLTNPDKPVSQVVDEFAAQAPDLALQVGVLGGTGEAFSKSEKTPQTPRDQAIDLEFGGQAIPASPELGLTVQARVEQEAQRMAGSAAAQAQAANSPALAATIAEVTGQTAPPAEAAPAAPEEAAPAPESDTGIPASEAAPVAEAPLGEENLPQPEAPVAAEFSPVTTATETPSSTANAAGGSQSVQTEPAEGSIPAVTPGNVPPQAEVSSAETQAAQPQGVVEMQPDQLTQLVPIQADLQQAQQRITPENAASVDLSQPIPVLRRADGSLQMLGGHHRWLAAQMSNRPLRVDIQNEVNTKPLAPNALQIERPEEVSLRQAPADSEGVLGGNTQGEEAAGARQTQATQKEVAPQRSVVDRINESSLSPSTTFPSLTSDIKNLTGNDSRQLQELSEALFETPIERPTAEKIARRLIDENLGQREANATRDRKLARDMLGEEKQNRGDELPQTDDKAPLTVGDPVVWQDENGAMQEGVLTKLNAGRNNLGEPVSTVALENSDTVQVPRRELRSVMASKRSPTAAGRQAAIQSLRGHLGEEVSVGASAVDSINAVAALQGGIPGVEKAWTGTRADFLEDEKIGQAFPEVRAALLGENGEESEGLFSGGRAFVFIDQVAIYEGDVETAKKEGTTPEQAAVERVITHEALAHRGFYALDKGTRDALFRWGAQNIFEAEMDQVAEEYGIRGNWVTDQATREYLLEEIIAKKIERLKSPPKSGPMKRLWDILERLWRRLTGRGAKPATLKDIQDVAKLLRVGLQLAENNVQTKDGAGITVDVVNSSRRPRFTSPLAAALSDTARSVRRMTEGTPENAVDLLAHYRDVLKGSSSAMVSLDDMFASAQRANPALTPRQFGEQLQALYDDNGAYIEMAESPATMTASAEKYNLRTSQGIPATYAMVLDPVPVKASRRVTPAQDAEYMAAVQSGDVAKQQAMVDEAARGTGYTVGPVYHGTSDQAVTKLRRGRSKKSDQAQNFPFQVFDTQRQGSLTKQVEMLPGAYFTPNKKYAEGVANYASNFGRNGAPVVGQFYLHRSVELVPEVSTEVEYRATDPSQIKSADPITRDENGNVIPLSQRFDDHSNDIRYSRRLSDSAAQKLNNTIRSAQEASGDATESRQTPIVGREVHIFPGQAFEARLDAAKQVIDALHESGVSDADMVDALNDPRLHRELGIQQDADMLGLLFAEAMSRGIPKAFAAYEVVRERAGRALGSGALLHSHPRFAHLFLRDGAVKQHNQQAEDTAKANANVDGSVFDKLDKEGRRTTSKEVQESAEDETFRMGEEALSKVNQALWQKLKNVVQRLGAATRIFAAKNAAAPKAKASLQGTISDKELAGLEAMSPDELKAEIDKLQAEFTSLAKQMLGTTKKPRAAKGKTDSGEGELTSAATARIIAQMAERRGAPVDTATAVAALTPEVGTLKAQFEKGIVSALVSKVKAAVTPKAKTGANLNSVMAQITKILSDNLNLPENAAPKAALADRALDAFGRTRTNDQTIREVWEKARGEIKALLTKRATEAAGEEITAEEAADIEAQVDEQLAAIAAEVPERMWAKGQAYSVIRDTLRELDYDTRAKVLADPAAARQAVVDKINSEVAKLPDVDAARWQANQSYLLASIDSLITDMQAAQAKAEARGRGEKRQAVFSSADSKTFASIMENARQRSGDKAPLLPESSTWSKIFSSSPQSQEDKAASMLAYMKADPALSQLTPEEQQKLADMFARVWSAKRKALLEAKVAAVLKKREATEKGKQAVKESIPKLIQAINRGELTDDVLYSEIADKFGFEKFTPKELSTIERLSKELQDPTLAVHERTGKMDELAKIVSAKTRLSKAEILSAWWTTAVLSGWKTAFTIGMAFQAGGFEVFTHAAATVARSYYQGNVADGLNAAKQSITNYFKTFPRGLQLMWQYVVTGDKRLLSQADPAYTQYFESGKNNPLSVGWKLSQDKRAWVRTAGRFMHFFERLLTALDLFNTFTTRQGMLALAYQINEKAYDAARVADETDLSQYRKKARDLYWGGVEPTEGKDKALLTRQSANLLEAALAKYANVLEDANFSAAQAAMTLTPEGLGGIFYRTIRGGATRLEIAAEKAVRDAERLTGVSPLEKAARKQLAYAERLAVHQALNLTGLRFARFAGNKLNQSLGFLPVIGLARLLEKGYSGSLKQQAIWRNQFIGTTLTALGVAALQAIADEPDDDKRGWGIEGSHENLDSAKANQLLTDGRPPYSIRLFGHTFNYANWPISSVLAGIGTMADRIKYDPKRWKEMSTGTRAAAAAWAGSMATFDVSALSQLSEIIGKSPYSRDPLEKGLGKASRVLGNFVGGAIPRILKDLDAVAPGGAELRKYEGWERFGKEVPVYRRFIGAPMLDIFGKPVEKQPYPWSREYQTMPVEPEYKLLGQLASKGVFPTPANPDTRRVGKGKRSREMTEDEKKRFITNVGEGYRRVILKNGERLAKMESEAAKDLLGKLTAKERDRAEWRAVHPVTEKTP